MQMAVAIVDVLRHYTLSVLHRIQGLKTFSLALVMFFFNTYKYKLILDYHGKRSVGRHRTKWTDDSNSLGDRNKIVNYDYF